MILEEEMGTKEKSFSPKRNLLERIRGFFNYLAITYDIRLPFLKECHDIIDGWRDNRDEESWKRERNIWKQILDYQLFEDNLNEEEFELLSKEKVTITILQSQ